jgi:hypothetical protein
MKSRGSSLALLALVAGCSSDVVTAGGDAQPTTADGGTPVADASAPDAEPADAGPPPPYGELRPIAITDTTTFGEAPPRGYYEYLPSRYDDEPQRLWPVIVALHGIGECGNGSLTDLDQLLDPGVGLMAYINGGNWTFHDRFIVLSPQDANSGTYMNPTKLQAFLDFAKAHYRLDESRMYLTGLSFGGRSAWDYVNTRGMDSEFAAVVTVPGDGSYDTFDCAKAGQTPHWAFQGKLDTNDFTNLAHVQASIEGINDCATAPVEPARLTVYPDLGHFVWGPTYSLSGMNRTFDLSDPSYSPYDVDIYTWFLAHTR